MNLSIITATTLLATATSASAVVVTFDDVPQGNNNAVPGFTVFGTYNGVTAGNPFIDGAGSTANGTQGVALNAQSNGFNTSSALLYDSGITLDAGSNYDFSVDVAKSGTGGNYNGNFVLSLFAGQPTVTAGGDGNRTANVAAGSATLLDSVTLAGTDQGTINLSINAPSASGTLFATFDAQIPPASGFSQVEIDNIGIVTTPVPEPASAALALAGLALLAGRRRR